MARGRGCPAVVAAAVVWGLAVPAAAASPDLVAVGAMPAQTAAPADAVTVATIRSQQTAIVQQGHQGPISLATLAVTEARTALAADQDRAAAARDAAAKAAATAADAGGRLDRDEAALGSTTAALSADRQRLADDRSRLGVIAFGLYTGELSNLQPTTLQQLEVDQQAVIDAGEVETVAHVVDGHLRADVADTAAAQRQFDQLTATVGRDATTLAADRAESARLAAAAANAASVVASDSQRLGTAQNQLAAAQDALNAELASVVGPAGAPAPGGLTIIGAAALNGAQLAAWFHYEGFADLTAAPITDLANWYIQAGQQIGIRGDVAFAQAVLETGGFSSPDSVQLSNFAGIGHCDTCAAGWGFPSPQAGVVGQQQLLRIFADANGSPPGAPPPVLPDLVPAKQFERGCCPTWESLTGVWATDPYYGASILSIYERMLQYATSAPRT